MSVKHEKLVGFFLNVNVPQTDDPEANEWHVHCIIERVTKTYIYVQFSCQDWLCSSFELPVPARIDNLWDSIRISVKEMVTDERIEYLCSI